MSLPAPEEEDPLKERRVFFIAAESDFDWDEEQDHVDHQRLILVKADALASENRLKEAIDIFSMALRYGSVRPDQLSPLVECILRNFKKKVEEETPVLTKIHQTGAEDNVFNCPGCHSFLGEPVTVVCGHSYCKRCSQLGLFSKCKLCNEDLTIRPGLLRTNVILSGFLEKCFPDEMQRSKTITETDCLIRRKKFEEALALANNLIDTGK